MHYLKQLHHIAEELVAIKQPLTAEQSTAIAKALYPGSTRESDILAITQARNAVADKIELREDALHRGYKVVAPKRSDFPSQSAYDRAYDTWAMRQGPVL